jgi:hypothetical protein
MPLGIRMEARYREFMRTLAHSKYSKWPKAFTSALISGLLAGIALEGLEQQHPARISTLWIPIVYQAVGGLDKEKGKFLLVARRSLLTGSRLSRAVAIMTEPPEEDGIHGASGL